MGKTKTKIIDDSISVESADQQVSKSAKKKLSNRKAIKSAKLESAKVIGEAERTPKVDVTENSGAKQINSEALKDDSDLETSKPTKSTERQIFDSEVVQTRGDPERKTEKKLQKPGKSKPRSNKYRGVVKDLDRSKTYSLDEAIDMVKKVSYSKFNGSLEAHIVTAQTGVRGLISLPFASGRKIRVLAFGKNAPESGADIIGDDSAIAEIEKGKINFDIIVTTPEWMPKLAKAAKILGPRGLMPNPKAGTITDDLKRAVASFQGGKTEYRTEGKAPVIHLALGKLNQPAEELSANIKTLLQTLGKSRVIKVHLAPTMGPSVKLDLNSF